VSPRYPLVLGILSLAIAIAAVAAALATMQLSVRLQELYAVNGQGSQVAVDALVRTSNLVDALRSTVGPLTLAATVPAVGALALLVVRQRASAGSASATASRDA
jgi:hypothetical protein